MKKPAWYSAPYIVSLGFLDWLDEQSQVSDSQAIKAAENTVRREGYPFIRRVGVGAALLGIAVLGASSLGPSMMRPIASILPPSKLLPGCAGMAFVGAAFLFWLAARRIWRRLRSLYRRGLRVLELRELALLDAKDRP